MSISMKTWFNSGNVLGCVWGLWHGEDSIQSECFGFYDCKKQNPLTETAIFRIASMTKPILGTAILQQHELGKIDLDSPIERWIPEYAKLNVAEKWDGKKATITTQTKRPITPRMLLTHTSGLGSGQTFLNQETVIKKGKTLGVSVSNYAKSLLAFQPGEACEYSPIWGMDVLAYIVELLTDMPFEEYIFKNIFTPLEMTDTTFFPNDEQAARVVDLAERTSQGFEKVDVSSKTGFYLDGFEDGTSSGSAGLFSTITDYNHFATMLLNGGAFRGTRILKPESVAMMSSPQLPQNMRGVTEYVNWGLSMRVCGKQDREIQPLPSGCYGWSGSYGTHFWVDPIRQYVGILMMNLRDSGGAENPLARDFERKVYFS